MYHYHGDVDRFEDQILSVDKDKAEWHSKHDVFQRRNKSKNCFIHENLDRIQRIFAIYELQQAPKRAVARTHRSIFACSSVPIRVPLYRGKIPK